MKKQKTKNDIIYEKLSGEILKLMGEGKIPWEKPWNASGNTPRNGVTQKSYSGINMYLSFLPYGSPDYFTKSQIQELGGHIRKGESGHYIVYWKIYTKKAQEAENQDTKTIPFLRHYVVWNREQIEGLPPAKDNPVRELDPLEEGDWIMSEYKDKPEIIHGGNKACYNPSIDKIFIPARNSFTGINEYYSTLFHECIHSTGGKNRLRRLPEDFTFGDADYSKEELVAELGAAFLCGIAGISNEGTVKNSAAYLQGWMKALKDDVKLFFDASRLAGKAVEYILGNK